MLPQDDAYGAWAASGEIDLMEIVGEKPHEVLNSIHFGSTFPRRSLITTTHALPEGSLVSVLDDYQIDSGKFSILWPSSRHLLPKLRVFVDFLSQRLRLGNAHKESRS